MHAEARQGEPAGGLATPMWLTHWRGNASLARSFWLYFALPATVLGLALGGLSSWMATQGAALRSGSLALLAGGPLALVVVTFGGIGAARAALGLLRSRRSVPPAAAALALVGAGVIAFVASGALHMVPQLPGLLSLALGHEPLGALQAELAPDGRRLRLQGAIGLGQAERVGALVQASPALRLLELDAPAGRLGEAQALARAVRERGLQTRITGRCGNACLLVFLAGRQRQLMPDARLALHRQAVPSLNPLWQAWSRRFQLGLWQEAGWPAPLVANTLASSAALPWSPRVDDLWQAGVLGDAAHPLDAPLPLPGGEQAADFADALRSHPLWLALERRHRGTLAAAATDMLQARRALADDAATQVAGQAHLQDLVPALLKEAGPEVRERFLSLLASQLAAVRQAGPAACEAVLAGDAAQLRTLPAELVEREAAWLRDAAAEPLSGTSAPPLGALEAEVLRRRLGERGPALLAGLVRPARAAGRGPACELATALVREVLALPAAERRLALRMMVEH